jgi:hypothetical protein
MAFEEGQDSFKTFFGQHCQFLEFASINSCPRFGRDV